MYSKNVIALSALLSLAAAVPMVKRDVVWVTETAEEVVTVPVTTTIWVSAGEAIPTGHYGHHAHSKSTIHVQSTVTVSPYSSPSASSPAAPVAPSSSAESSPAAPSSPAASATTSVYVAPTPSSSSVYVAPTTSSTSVYVAPTPSSSSVYVAPATTSAAVYSAPATTSAAPAATSSASSGSSSGAVTTGPGAAGTSYTGDLTWYQDGLGACGLTNGPSDHIVAISEVIYDSYNDNGNPNANPMCGQTVSITGADGSTYTATVVDRCVGCAEGDLDLSEDFFNTVTNNGNGRVPGVSWKFN